MRLSELAPLRYLVVGGARKTSKINTFHVWAYPAGIYRPEALKFFVHIFDVISKKSW